METDSTREGQVIQRLVGWGEAQPSIRALILTSTRTNPQAPLDLFSDYDVIVAVTDVQPFLDDDGWLEAFGPILALYRDPVRLDHGLERFARITQYEGGLKIDFTVCAAELVPRIAAEPELRPELDVGYTILLDKDGLTEGLQPPSRRAYVPSPPTEAEYYTTVELFFHEATYVVKHLWRDDLLPAKYNLDHMMKHELLRTMLEWHMEIAHDWSVKTGAYGKGLKKWTEPGIWAALEATYVGAGLEENWAALFRTIDLFRRVAIEVGEALGYAYPHDLDRRAMAYFYKVQGLGPDATSFD
jgi:aminoglycoside 6-adenylyltransferase